MQRFLPALAAVLLVVVGVGTGIMLLASRDHGSIAPASAVANTAGKGPLGLADGNVVILVGTGADRTAVDGLAAQLGAIDTKASRAAGQALVSKRQAGLSGVKAQSGTATLVAASASDPTVQAFVRQHLGRVGP